MSSASSLNMDWSKIVLFGKELRQLNLLTLPNNILDMSKLKALADDKENVTQELKLVFGKVENIVGKGEHAVNQPFSISPTNFQCCRRLRHLKTGKLNVYELIVLASETVEKILIKLGNTNHHYIYSFSCRVFKSLLLNKNS